MIQQTSINAINEIVNSKRRAMVYNAIVEFGECNNMMISKRLNLPINCITGRVKELRDKGMVEESYKDYCPYTKQMTIFWRIK